MAFLGAGGVKLIDQLKDPLQDINKKRQGALQTQLGGIGDRQLVSSRASGRVRGEYAPAELARAGARSSRGIEDTLLGALGGSSLDEQRKQQEHEANLALTEEIGRLSAPSLLEQVLSGLGSGGKSGAQFYGLYNSLNQPKQRQPNPNLIAGYI